VALRAIVASFALHAGVAAGLVAAGSGGHAVPGAPTNVTAEVLEIDTSTETSDVPMTQPEPEQKTERGNVVAPPPDHTHPYPVPGHDARPHDPSQPHTHAPADHHDQHEHAHDDDHAQGSPAAAAAVVANDSAAKMPVFSIASGSGSMTAGTTRVADGQDGKGNRAGSSGATNDGAGANVTYAVSGVSVAAKLVSSVTAAYPVDARADDVEGDVGLEIVVDAEGRVVDARVAKSAGHGFDESALAAIRRYRFSAAQRDGRNVRVRMPWTVQFRLR
jgi:TonB family protein